MKRIVLAIGTVAMGIAGTALFGQSPPQAHPPQPRPDYSLYGGPPSQSQPPERRGTTTPRIGPVYKMYGVPDEIGAADKAREARRNAAVEFGMFRRQFTGSTEFWMDYDRTRLAKVRYSMDEAMWRSIHPAYDFGDGGYMYNTAASAVAPWGPGPAARMTITTPETNVYQVPIVDTNGPPTAPVLRQAPAPIPSSPAIRPSDRLNGRTVPLFAGGPGSNPAAGR
jgi:hypothetical protein